MINIVTCICVDKDESEDSVYPQLNYRTSQQRRLIYWKCAAVSFATSIRCNPGIRHILYTNDQAPVRYKGRNLREFLSDMGVEIRYLPFEVFKPLPGVSKRFRNAFYKLDVIRELGKYENEYSILLDSDCVWVKNNSRFLQTIDQDKLLLYDCYQRSDPNVKRSGISQIDLGNIFKTISPDYPVQAPVHYGGEIIGGNGKMLRRIAGEIQDIFQYVTRTYGNTPPAFSNGYSVFDNDEYLASYVYNKMPDQIIDARNFIHRMAAPFQGDSLAAIDHTIWHLYAEKKLGFMFLFKKVFDRKSAFWKVPLSTFDVYVGRNMGIPKRVSLMDFCLVYFYKGWYAFRFVIRQKLRKLSV